MTPEELLALLGSEDVEDRARGLTWADDNGGAAVPNLLAVLRDPAAGVLAQTWAMIAVGVVGPAATDAARQVLHEKLADPSPTLRRAAIRTLMALDDVASRDAIARLLTDGAADPTAWFDADAIVGQAARNAIDSLDRPR
jgi:HEAT repeat protein